MLNKYFAMTMGVCVSASASVSLADTYTVPTSKHPTIQSAINSCNANGDEIICLQGVYPEEINFMGKAIHLHSATGNTSTVIDGQGKLNNLVRFISGESSDSIIEGFTIRNSNQNGISIVDSSPTIRDCKVLNCGDQGIYIQESDGSGVVLTEIYDCEFRNNGVEDEQGAAIYVYSAGNGKTEECRVNIYNSLFSNNISNQIGGAIYAKSTYISLYQCQFIDNFAVDKGGAIYMDGGGLSVSGVIFNGNSTATGSEAMGGAIYLDDLDSSASLANCDFQNNHVRATGGGTAHGGAIWVTTSTINLFQCNFTSNYASFEVNNNCRGGAISGYNNIGIMDRCVFDGNYTVMVGNHDYSAMRGGHVWCGNYFSIIFDSCEFKNGSSYSGGAVYIENNSSPTFLNCTFSENTCSFTCCGGGRGGAIYSLGTPIIQSCLFNENSAFTSGGAIESAGSGGFVPTVLDSLFCGNISEKGSEIDHISGGFYDDQISYPNYFSDDCGGDCQPNGFPDIYDLFYGISEDCNENNIPDECDIASGGDCNGNGVPDECDIANGDSEDCDNDGTPNECDLDCNDNGTSDVCDLLNGDSEDCNGNGVPDECDDIVDCQPNGVDDTCDITNGTSDDVNLNGIPDECECPADINGDGYIDVTDLLAIVASWGSCSSCSEDINGDGYVNVTDLLTVIDGWGTCP